MEIPVKYKKSLTTAQLQTRIRNDSSGAGKAIKIKRDATHTHVTYDGNGPPAGQLVVVAEGDSPPDDATEVCAGDGWIADQQKKIAIYES